jgi:hypothetical protein
MNSKIFEYKFPGEIIRDIINKPDNVEGWI